MISLLLDRSTKKLSAREFALSLTESLYSTLLPQTPSPFPHHPHTSLVTALDIEKNNHKFLLSGSSDSSIKLWELDTQKAKEIATVPRKSVHSFGVSALKWWPQDSGMFLSSSFDHQVHIWDTNAFEVAHTFDLENRVYSIDVCAHSQNAFSSQALVATACDHPYIRLLDLRAGSSAHTLPGHKGKVLSVAWHPQEAWYLASGGLDGELKIWDIRQSKSCLARLDMTKSSSRLATVDLLNLGSTSVKAHLGPVNAVVWSELGNLLYTAGNDDKIRVWDMTTTMAPPINKLINFGPLTRNKYMQTLPLMLSPLSETECQYLLFPSDNGDVLVFRALDGKLVSRLQKATSQQNIRTTSMAYAGPFSATYLCGNLNGDIISWRGENLRQLSGNYEPVGVVG